MGGVIRCSPGGGPSRGSSASEGSTRNAGDGKGKGEGSLTPWQGRKKKERRPSRGQGLVYVRESVARGEGKPPEVSSSAPPEGGGKERTLTCSSSEKESFHRRRENSSPRRRDSALLCELRKRKGRDEKEGEKKSIRSPSGRGHHLPVSAQRGLLAILRGELLSPGEEKRGRPRPINFLPVAAKRGRRRSLTPKIVFFLGGGHKRRLERRKGRQPYPGRRGKKLPSAVLPEKRTKPGESLPAVPQRRRDFLIKK